MGDELIPLMPSIPPALGIGELATLPTIVGLGDAELLCSCPPCASCKAGVSSAKIVDVNAMRKHLAFGSPPPVGSGKSCEKRPLKPQSGRKED